MRSPLEETGFTKTDIRNLSLYLALPTWDKPAFACLSSRFPYGTSITSERVRQVGQVEDALRKFGLRILRVRYQNTVARLELGQDKFTLATGPLREQVEKIVKDSGFIYVTVDLLGNRSGSMNDIAESAI